MSNYGKHRWLKLLGQKFGRLAVLGQLPSRNGKTLWLCQCDCDGKLLECLGVSLTSGSKRSCGCLQRELASKRQTTHGMSTHRVYHIWRNMCDRCTLSTAQAWKNYGGRGIKVCGRWLESFENFWSDMQDGYEPGLTLNRVDNDGDYCKENCEWATYKAQMNNKRDNVRIQTPNGEMTVGAAADHYGISRTTLHYRINHDWPMAEWFSPVDLANGYRNHIRVSEEAKKATARAWDAKNRAKRTRQARERGRRKTQAKRAAAGLPPKVYK